jgi:hypothetical protein
MLCLVLSAPERAAMDCAVFQQGIHTHTNHS